MTNRLYINLILHIFAFTSCHSQAIIKQNNDTTQSLQFQTNQEPNYNYFVSIPDGWTIHDTIMLDGKRIRLLLSPLSMQMDRPIGNILIAKMNGRDIDDFTTDNMKFLKANMSGISILKRGNIDSTIYNGQWFTYLKENNGVVREMINYIIPMKGFAYMITFGSNKGSIHKYRAIFDKVAKSFKG